MSAYLSNIAVQPVYSLPKDWDHLFWFDADSFVTQASGVSQVLDRYGGPLSLLQPTPIAQPAIVPYQGRLAFQSANGKYLNLTANRGIPITIFMVVRGPTVQAPENYSQVIWNTAFSPLVWGTESGYSTAPAYYANGATRSLAFTLVFTDLINNSAVLCFEIQTANSRIYKWAQGLPKTVGGLRNGINTVFNGAQTVLNVLADTTLFWRGPVGTIAATKGILSPLARDGVMTRLANYYAIKPL